MPVDKLSHAMFTIYETIRNRVSAGELPSDIANAMAGKYRLEMRLYEVSPKMIRNFYELLAEQCYYDLKFNHNHALKKGE